VFAIYPKEIGSIIHQSTYVIIFLIRW